MQEMHKMKILLLGANGYVGSRIFFELRKSFDVIGTYRSTPFFKDFTQLDVTNSTQVETVISDINPDVIIHAANNASSRWCEANPEAAISLNQTSTQYVIDAAKTTNSRLIYFSSFAAFEPTSVYGKTKIASEQMIKESLSNYAIIRPCAIFGYSPNTTGDKLFNTLLTHLDQKLSTAYDASWKFQPTYIGHVAEVIEAVIKRTIVGETIPVAVPELSSIYDTIHDILLPFGVEVAASDNIDTTHFSKAFPLNELNRLDLPKYSYEQMVQSIIGEIRHRQEFTLN